MLGTSVANPLIAGEARGTTALDTLSFSTAISQTAVITKRPLYSQTVNQVRTPAYFRKDAGRAALALHRVPLVVPAGRRRRHWHRDWLRAHAGQAAAHLRHRLRHRGALRLRPARAQRMVEARDQHWTAGTAQPIAAEVRARVTGAGCGVALATSSPEPRMNSDAASDQSSVQTFLFCVELDVRGALRSTGVASWYRTSAKAITPEPKMLHLYITLSAGVDSIMSTWFAIPIGPYVLPCQLQHEKLLHGAAVPVVSY
eukprot:6185645-Pleurochrysis_carterae.AAC.3